MNRRGFLAALAFGAPAAALGVVAAKTAAAPAVGVLGSEATPLHELGHMAAPLEHWRTCEGMTRIEGGRITSDTITIGHLRIG